MNKKNLLELKDLERVLLDKRSPIAFTVIYANAPNKKVVHKEHRLIQWKRGVTRCTVRFSDGEWHWNNGDAVKYDAKRVRK